MSRISSLKAGALVSVFTMAPAFAADFRTLDFDASCKDVATLEAARNSRAYEGRLPSGYQFAFHATDMDQDVVVVYACRDDRFFRGGYIFPTKGEADALRLYAQVKKRVIAELGAPSYDFSSAAHLRKMKELGATLSETDKRVAFWDTEKSEAHTSIVLPTPDHDWQVSLSYTARSALEE